MLCSAFPKTLDCCIFFRAYLLIVRELEAWIVLLDFFLNNRCLQHRVVQLTGHASIIQVQQLMTTDKEHAKVARVAS